MSEETMVDLVRARKTPAPNQLLIPLAGILIVMIVIWFTVSVRIQANMADIQRLEQVTIAVARIDTDVAHIKRSIASLERMAADVLHAQQRMEAERRLEQSIPPAVKGMLRRHFSARRNLSS